MDRTAHIVGTAITPMNRRDRTAEDMAQQVVAEALADADVDAADVNRALVTDSPQEAVELIRDRSMKGFGLTYGPATQRRWFLGER